MQIGFIGLGKMGSGLAKNLIRAGYNTLLYDINSKAVEKIVLEVGGTSVTSSKEIALEADVIFTSLPLPNHLLDLTIDKDNILQVMKAGALLIDVSTIDSETARRIAEEAQNHNVDFLACPLGKGPAQAEEGTEPIYVGGKREVYEAYKYILEKIGDPAYLGDVEQSTAFKLISNMVGMTNLAILSEGIQLAKQSGIELDQFKELMHGTGADSAQLHLRGPLMLSEEYTAKFSVNLAEKDVRLGIRMAESLDSYAEFSKLALKHFQEAQQLNLGDNDAAAIYRTFQNKLFVKS
jgi:3-hydroxyisobutyrate dehydrogenase-like beta-hydroxyacid dehydrogenase